MKHRIFALCVFFAGFTATAGAQVPSQVQAPAQAAASFTIQCQPTLVTYLFTSTEGVMAYLCETNATINGVAFQGLAFSQVSQGNASGSEDRGVIVGALANGDQVFFQYQATSRRTGNTTSAAIMNYKIVGGTGTATGITGSGTCNATGTIGKGNVQNCSGTYAVR
jgi:hypothetical protein